MHKASRQSYRQIKGTSDQNPWGRRYTRIGMKAKSQPVDNADNLYNLK